MTTAIEEARKMAATIIKARPTVENVDIILHGGADDGAFVSAFLAAIELGERREREAVVGWLRFDLDDWPDYVAPSDIADAIERGDHHPAAVEAMIP